MYTSEDDSKKNTKSLLVGFFLIIFVVILFFLKTYLLNGKKETANKSEEQITKEYASISVDDLLIKINSKEKIVIFDLRNINEFEKEHILDAKNISAENLINQTQSLSKDTGYFIVDDFGLTPQEINVMENFKKNEFKDVFYVEGGFSAWKNKLSPTISFGDVNSFIDQSKVAYIKSEELKESFLQEKNLYIIDLRSTKDFMAGHLKDAMNMRVDELESRRHEIPLGKKVIVYGADDAASFSGAVKLFDMGIFNAHILSGGFSVWKEKGFEIVQ